MLNDKDKSQLDEFVISRFLGHSNVHGFQDWSDGLATELVVSSGSYALLIFFVMFIITFLF